VSDLIELVYDPANGVALTDNQVRATIDSLCLYARKGHGHVLVFGTELLFHALRAAAAEGRISVDRVRLSWVLSDARITYPVLNQDGSVSEWPKGFCENYENALERILMSRGTVHSTSIRKNRSNP
jgi:hypothetical protein